MIEAPPSFKPAVKYSDISGLLVSRYTVKPLLSEHFNLFHTSFLKFLDFNGGFLSFCQICPPFFSKIFWDFVSDWVRIFQVSVEKYSECSVVWLRIWSWFTALVDRSLLKSECILYVLHSLTFEFEIVFSSLNYLYITQFWYLYIIIIFSAIKGTRGEYSKLWVQAQ